MRGARLQRPMYLFGHLADLHKLSHRFRMLPYAVHTRTPDRPSVQPIRQPDVAQPW